MNKPDAPLDLTQATLALAESWKREDALAKRVAELKVDIENWSCDSGLDGTCTSLKVKLASAQARIAELEDENKILTSEIGNIYNESCDDMVIRLNKELSAARQKIERLEEADESNSKTHFDLLEKYDQANARLAESEATVDRVNGVALKFGMRIKDLESRIGKGSVELAYRAIKAEAREQKLVAVLELIAGPSEFNCEIGEANMRAAAIEALKAHRGEGV